MTFTQLICLQLLLLVVSQQILANPAFPESSETVVIGNRNLASSRLYAYDNPEDIVSEMEKYENFRQHLLNKVTKRRAKANLAGLWGVPTKFA